MVRITFQYDGEIVEDDLSLSILQISLKHGIPHQHACGGMGRCSTCRILVVNGCGELSTPNDTERSLADRKGFASNIRLACQTRPLADVTVRRLVRDDTDLRLTSIASETTGREEQLAIMFTDVRGFTTFSEHNLPYDVIHILDRLFLAQGEAIFRYEGTIDKYIGDGVMALFGLSGTGTEASCLNAVRAGLDIQKSMAPVRDYLIRYFGTDLRIGIGIHFGTVVVGEVGHPRKRQFTAIGDAVNTASRIESATKELGAGVLISGDTLACIEGKVRVARSCTVTLKGKEGSHPVYEVIGLSK